MSNAQEIEALARQAFGVPDAHFVARGGHEGVTLPVRGHAVFLEYQPDGWHVLHGRSLQDCGNPPVHDMRGLVAHMIDAAAD